MAAGLQEAGDEGGEDEAEEDLREGPPRRAVRGRGLRKEDQGSGAYMVLRDRPRLERAREYNAKRKLMLGASWLGAMSPPPDL